MKILINNSLIVMAFLLVACDGSNSGSDTIAKTITGTVTYRHEPVTEGTVIVQDSSGQTVTSSERKGKSHYSVSMPGNV